MKGYVKICEIETYTSEDNQILSKVSFTVDYDDGQKISTYITMSAFQTSHNQMVEQIKKYFNGDLEYRYDK